MIEWPSWTTLEPDLSGFFFAKVLVNITDTKITHSFRCVRGMIFGSDYLTVLNPDFVTDLVKEYLLYAPTEPVQQGQAIPPGTYICLQNKVSCCLSYAIFKKGQFWYDARLFNWQWVQIKEFQVFMTSIKDNSLNPRWNEKFHVTVCHQVEWQNVLEYGKSPWEMIRR